MDAVENEEEVFSSKLVDLKEGINLQDLRDGKGAAFEVNTVDTPEDDTPFKREELWEHLNHECLFGTDENENENQTPFESMGEKMETLTEDRGVLKKILRTGTGPVVPQGATVRLHYNGYLEYSDEPFDSSRLRNKMQQFRLGYGEVIPGWDVGVATMRKTELARFLVKPDWAYGKLGCPPRIPPDAVVMFEIELVTFIDYKAASDYSQLSPEDRRQMTVEDLIAVANAERASGNDLFDQRQYARASSKYAKGVQVLEPARLEGEDDEKLWKTALLKLYLNLALCSLRQSRARRAITHCHKALDLDPLSVKGIFRLGQAYLQMGEWDRSRENLLRAARMSPSNAEIRKELVRLDEKVAQFRSLEKSMCARMFSSNGSVTNGKAHAEEQKKKNPDSVDPALRETFLKKLMSFKENREMMSLTLPLTTSESDLQCIESLLEELELTGERGDQRSGFSIKVRRAGDPCMDANEF